MLCMSQIDTMKVPSSVTDLNEKLYLSLKCDGIFVTKGIEIAPETVFYNFNPIVTKVTLSQE